MKAVITTAPNALEVVDIAIPTPGPGQALVRMERAGICGTDVKVFKGGIVVDHPRVMGHEMVGIVEEPAKGGRVAKGTRVLIDPAICCDYCDLCQRDKRHLCRNGGLLGRDIDGVFGDFSAVTENLLHPVPDEISDDASGVLQVLGTVVHAQRTITTFPNQVGVVVGLGVSGLLHMQMLRARGIKTVIGVNRSKWKRDLALELGADLVAAPGEAAAVVAEATGGRGADIVIESVGQESTLAQAIELAGHAADIIIFGTLTAGDGNLPYYQLYFKELTLYNPRAAGAGDYATGIELTAAGKLSLEPLVTSRYTLDTAAEAFTAVSESSTLKVLMEQP